MLLDYPWPGNVRQLENTIFRAVVLCDRPFLTQDDFPQIAGIGHNQPSVPVAAAAPLPLPGHDERPVYAPAPTEPPLEAMPAALPHHPPVALTERLYRFDPPAAAQEPSGEIAARDGAGHLRPLHEIESEVIRLALEHYRGHMSEVARRLGIGRSTLYRKVRELGLDKHAVER
jgi:DNA-binding NtrC family response regulator